MPHAWSKNDEQQYEQIRQSELDRGRSKVRAEEIAARTVNKQRREEGRTESGTQRSSGTGNPNTPLNERTKDEVYNVAREMDIPGRSGMTKGELISAIHERR